MTLMRKNNSKVINKAEKQKSSNDLIPKISPTKIIKHTLKNLLTRTYLIKMPKSIKKSHFNNQIKENHNSKIISKSNSKIIDNMNPPSVQIKKHSLLKQAIKLKNNLLH